MRSPARLLLALIVENSAHRSFRRSLGLVFLLALSNLLLVFTSATAAPTISEFERTADLWLAAAGPSKGYSFDRFFPGIAGGSGCLHSPQNAPVTIALDGGTVTVRRISGSALVCAISDVSSSPRVSDGTVGGSDTYVMVFNPPISAFYTYYGSLPSGQTSSMKLFSGGVEATTLVSVPGVSTTLAIGHGFISSGPIDSIEITTTDPAIAIGAFVGLASGEPSLGTEFVTAYGANVQRDFACTFIQTAEVTIANAQGVEGNSGTSALDFTVSLSDPICLPVTVDYATSDGTATVADNDYVAAMGTLTFDPLPPAFERKWGSSGSGDGQFINPYGVAVDGSGNVYVTDGSNNRIQKFDSSGNFLLKWGSVGIGNGQFNNPHGVAVDGDGNVYVSDTNNNRIQKFDSSGNFLLKWGSGGSGDGQFSTPYGLATDASNNVYVVDRSNRRIQKFESNGSFLLKWGSSGSGDGQFNAPYGVAVDGSGNVYVSDFNNRRIQKFDSSGNFLLKWGSSGSGDGQFLAPRHVAVDACGSVYVVDLSIRNVQKFDGNGNFLLKWGTNGSGDGQFFAPYGVAVDGSESVYVSDISNRRIQKFTPPAPAPQTITVDVTGDTSFEPDEAFSVALSSPTNATLGTPATAVGLILNDDKVEIAIADAQVVEGNSGTSALNFSVSLSAPFAQVVTVDYATADATATLANNDYTATNGTLTFNLLPPAFALKWGSSGSGNGQFSSPYDVAVDGSGNVYVSDLNLDRIQKFDSNGNFLLKWGNGGSSDGQFGAPWGVAVDGSGNVYVSDISLRRIQKFDSNGNFLLKWGSSGGGDGQFGAPYGVAVDGSGNVYVSDPSLDRIQKFDSNGNFLLKWGSSGNGDGQFFNPIGVAVDGSGNVYVSDTSLDRIQKFDSNGAFLLKWGSSGSGDGQFLNPNDLEVDGSGNVYVLDSSLRWIQKFDGDGTFLHKWGSSGSGDGQFITPYGVAVDESGNVYASDVSLRRMQKFAPVGTIQTISINVTGDTKLEQDETLQVNLSNPSGNATISDAQGIGTIQNDDGVPTVSISGGSAIEGSAGTTPLMFTVTLSNETDQAVSVDYETADGSATTANGDYAAAAGTAVILAKTLSTTFTVLVNGDTDYEPNETFNGTLSNPVNATLGTATAMGQIVNDDPVEVAITDAQGPEGDSGTSGLDFTVSLSGPIFTPVTVDYATADATATLANNDYTATNGTLTFTPVGGGPPTFVLKWGSSGSGDGQFSSPWGMGVDASGNVYVADLNNRRIQKFDSNGNFLLEWGSGGSGDGQFIAPYGVAVDGDGNIYVVDNSLQRIQKFDSNGNFLLKWGSSGSGDGQFSSPLGVAVDGSGNVYVSDISLQRIQKFDSNGNFLLKWGSSGSGDGQFSSPLGVAVDGSGNVYVSEVGLQRIQKFDSDGNFLLKWGSSGSGDGQFSNPYNVAVDASGSVYASDFSLNRIQKFDSDGNFLLKWGTSGSGDGQFNSPSGVVVDGGGNVYVAEFNGNRIQKFTQLASVAPDPQTITVDVKGDTKREQNETFEVNLSNPINATVPDPQGIGTIQNDDGVPSISIADATPQFEGTSLSFSVSLSNHSDQEVTVAYATSDGSATVANGDYVATSGVLTFAAKTTDPLTVTVTALEEDTDEGDETLTVTLSNPTNATLGDASAEGTIFDNDGAPTLSIDDPSSLEGNAGTTALVFTITLSHATDQPVSVDYATADGSATLANDDYDATTGTAVIAAKTLTTTFSVLVNGDITVEGDETLVVNLSDPINATLGDAQGTGTIANDDLTLPVVSVDNLTASEGDAGTTAFGVTLSLSHPTDQDVTVGISTADGSATLANNDYVSVSSTATIPAKALSATFTVLVNGDLTRESDETFTLSLSSPVNATIGTGTGTVTISNDDTGPTVSIADMLAPEGDTGSSPMVLTVSLSNPTDQEVTVEYETIDVSAIAGIDYVATSGTVTIPAKTLSTTVTVQLTGDLIDESDETFTVKLKNPVNAGLGDDTGTGTIQDDDGLPTVFIVDATVVEGNPPDTPSLVFTIAVSNPTAQPVTVQYATSDGSATVANSDYVPIALATATIPANDLSTTVAVQVNGDLTGEDDETLTVTLTNPVNADLGNAVGVGTIEDDDGTPTVSIDDVAVVEGNPPDVASLSFTVSLSHPADQQVTVDYATADGTATDANNDYEPTSGTLTFTAKSTGMQSITVQVNGDLTLEANETIAVNLSNPTQANLGDPQGIGTITNDDVVPAVSIDDVAALEGDAGTSALTFTVTLSHQTDHNVTVGVATADGSATVANNDYESVSSTATILAKTLSATVTVLLNGDNTVEGDETLVVDLFGPNNATLGDAQGIGTITNDDLTLPAVSVGDVTAAEGDAATTAFGFALTLSHPTDQDITVSVATADGSATTANNDYGTVSGTATILAKTLSTTVTVLVNGDLTFETDETFMLNLSNPVNATIGTGSGTGTISNDDAGPTVSIDDVMVAEGDVGTTPLTFTVSLSNPTEQDVTVAYATNDVSATAGGDYVAGTGTLTIAAKTLSTTVTVQVSGDVVDENDETFEVTLSSPVNAALGDGTGEGTIQDDDGVPTVSIADATVVEGDAGTAALIFTLSLSNPTALPVTVQYATSDGSATLVNDDYVEILTLPPTTTVIAANTLSTTVAVQVIGDVTGEGDETLTVTLSNPVNASLGDAQGTGTIEDDDGVPTILIDDVAVFEGNPPDVASLVFTVSLSHPGDQEVTVQYATADGSATEANNDYQPSSGTLTFAAKLSASQSVTVPVNGDLVFESNETLAVNLSNASNATIADAQGIGTIDNDDGTPFVSIHDVAVAEGDAGTTALIFTVTLSHETDQLVVVSYATADGSATIANSDYNATAGTAVIAAKTLSTTVTVLINGDVTQESDETFTVTISDPINAMMGIATGIGTISNDDGVPSVSIDDVTVAEGDAGTTPLTFTISLSNPTDQDVTVSYTTADGSATVANNDYVAAAATATIAAKSTSTTVTVQANGDLVLESDETFFVDLLGVANAIIGDGQGQGTIENDDDLPTIAISDPMEAEGNVGMTAFVFTVTLSNPTDTDVTIDWATADGTATQASNDYQANAGTVTIAAKTAAADITVFVNGDSNLEPGGGFPDFVETFFVDLSNPVGAAFGDNQGEGRIVDDEATPALLQRFEPLAGYEGIELRWQFSDAGMFAAVVVERAEAEEGPWTEVAVERRDEDGVTVALDRSVAPLTTYYYRLVAATPDDQHIAFGAIEITSAEALEFALTSMGPNPMRTITRIDYAVARSARVTLSVYDIQGREVAVLAEGVHRAGRYQAVWNGQTARGVAHAGIYFVRYQTPEQSFVRRISLTR